MSLVSDIRRVFRLLDPSHRWKFFFVVVLMVLAAALQVASVASIYPFLSVIADRSVVEDGWLTGVYQTLGFQSVERFLAALALLMFVLMVASNGVLMWKHWAMAHFVHTANHTLSTRLLRSYLHRDYSFFLQRNSSELQKNVVTETKRVAQKLLKYSIKFLSKGLVAVGLLILLFVMDPVATLIVIGVIGGGFVATYQILRRRLTRLGHEYLMNSKKRHKTALESFGGIKDVKMLGREDDLVARFEPYSQAWADALARYEVLKYTPKYLIEALAMGGLLIILAIMLLTGQPVAAIIPLMGLFVFAGYRLMPVFKELMSATAAFRFSEAILDLVEKDLGDGPEPPARGTKVEPLPFYREVHIKDATFHYPGASMPALDRVDVSVPKNTTVAFVGETGAGKTTLVDMFLALYTPQEGALLVDGTLVTGDRVRAWQRNIGYVPQDIFLTDDSVRRNIAIGLSDDQIDDKAVERAARIAHIHDFIITELPDGYDTTVGERGVRLSGGQRQRIGIARALYHDPDVLVLDEATSDIDNITEANITNAIERLAGTKTLVIIAHRLSTIRNADRIYMLDHGRVIAAGTYDELSAHSKAFMQLAQVSGAVTQT